ncbi:MAG: isoleucine--tRNA ligase [Bacteroidetes bacterium]|nr:isoleucine--tRNA ligase [Bacteroidota bacterium]MBV6461110.1 Isoleucine--tRNA ligase [Flavobacteriales bacterium]WKZ75491.1 MAG: isoleucine--tRNA ligase [Vicingaceae bacterium]MCL4815059.1 isoleucine--tRNA ligase [Flavobacteriales bacterium]NOG94834.1 isoleucine--tRNA ligase [Bacteroidota bacterium]
MQRFNEYKILDLPTIAKEILQKWSTEKTFEKSISTREGKTPFIFYEGPPSANGMPGIHHVMARTIKDIFCRYKTLKGFHVKRKAGWDTHGLPIELSVEKELGITKEDIGKKISVDDYNTACRKAVMKYTDQWENLTALMGYWVDMKNPYITYDNKYIESVWWLLKNIYDKKLLYKGYSIQPYSPAAGTGLSSHELNQPGCYKNVKDTSAVAMFKLTESSKQKIEMLCKNKCKTDIHFLAWTTTPWTLPSNTALAVGEKIDYVLAEVPKPFSKTKEVISIVFAVKCIKNLQKISLITESLINEGKYPIGEHDGIQFVHYFKGKDLVNLRYEQLLPYALPHENADKAFRVISGDFVTTEDGTGIVHIAPTFGADDMRVAKEADIPPLLVPDEYGKSVPLVDLRGRFRPEMHDEIFGFAGEYVKEAFLSELEKKEELAKQKEKLKGIISDTTKLQYLSVDERIVLKLQNEGKLFKKEKYEHNYPHCWRTDKPVLYYPLDSWFINVPKIREKLVSLNTTIHWKPESTGTGRFGNWLENANDWNLSRSRYWGIPLPIWRSEDGEEKCIGSLEELKNECSKAFGLGLMKTNPLGNFVPNNFSEQNYRVFDMHRPYVDEIILASSTNKPMKRELDLIDVWFDSGSMPYAQLHYPFEGSLEGNFPADFIAEGVDQTRGWFYTLHTIATLCFDSVAYRNVISNGLVLDKNGQKMSKRLGNAVDPFETLKKYGPDATRWYMITNAQPWDNLKFDLESLAETQRKFFRALYNTYAFFALYANVDGFTYKEEAISFENRPELDQWIISKLNSLIKTVDKYYEEYEPTKAGREIETFVLDHLSNWYVRLSRRRFWKGDYTHDKISAYQTLYTCIETVALLASPIAPFFTDKLFFDLNKVTQKHPVNSVHLADFPIASENNINTYLEEKMAIAQQISSMVLAIRKKENIKVRQPLQKIMVPVLSNKFKEQLNAVKELVLAEVNVKEIEFLNDSSSLVKQIKPNFKTLGPKYGKHMKVISAKMLEFKQSDILHFESSGLYEFEIGNEKISLSLQDVEITSQDIPGFSVSSEAGVTVAIDINISPQLKEEGIAREIVNRIQNLRKEKGFDLTDKISLKIQQLGEINSAIYNNKSYICSETLAESLELVENTDAVLSDKLEIDEQIFTNIVIHKLN